jgi:hypothetical protein
MIHFAVIVKYGNKIINTLISYVLFKKYVEIIKLIFAGFLKLNYYLFCYVILKEEQLKDLSLRFFAALRMTRILHCRFHHYS